MDQLILYLVHIHKHVLYCQVTSNVIYLFHSMQYTYSGLEKGILLYNMEVSVRLPGLPS